MKKILLIVLLGLLTINTNCGVGGSSSDTSGRTALTINLGEVRETPSFSEQGLVSASSIPAHVVSIRITISAPDMATIQQVIPTAGLTSISVTIEVPNGPNRHIVVEALNDTGGVLYRGETYVNLDGTPVSVPIVMVSADPFPPTFAGINDITSITQTSMVLSWLPATDNVTPQDKIQYLIYMATSSGGQNFSMPSFTTSPGVTSYMVSGLNPNTTYYFVVLAMDEVGNKSTTIAEASGTTLPPPDTNPPTFGGLESATALSSTEINLQWSEATDDVTPSSDIVYLIYMATASGGQNFATPTATTSPGATDYTLTGLSPETMYCFVVRARDEAGNTETNTIERCDTTPAPPPSLSVSPSTVTVVALPNPDPLGSDNVIFTVEGINPPFTVTSSNTDVIADPGEVLVSGGTFTVDPDQDCSTTLVTLTVTDSDSESVDATVNLTIPAFTATLASNSICENNNTCTAGTETTTLSLTGVPPFNVTSSQPAVIPDPGMSWTNTYTIDAIDNSITADTIVNLSSSSYCDSGPNVSSVTVIDQLDIDLEPINDGMDTSLIFCDVANYGTDDAENVEVWFDYTNGESDNCDSEMVSVSGGSTQPVSHAYVFDPVYYRIIVDPNNLIQETNESNNCISNHPTMCSDPLPEFCDGW